MFVAYRFYHGVFYFAVVVLFYPRFFNNHCSSLSGFLLAHKTLMYSQAHLLRSISVTYDSGLGLKHVFLGVISTSVKINIKSSAPAWQFVVTTIFHADGIQG